MYDDALLHPSVAASPTPEGIISSPQSPLFPGIYGGGTMLSTDKVVSCKNFALKHFINTTFATTTPANNGITTPWPSVGPMQNRPGATIVSPIVLSLAGITGQIIALYYLHRKTKPSYSCTVFSVLLSTLIWTDLIGKLITTPPAIVSYANGKWMGGEKLCHLHGYCMILIDSMTHYLVSAMAMDRFVCVKYGYFYKSKVTKSRARILLMSLWLFCVVFCALPLFGFGEFELQYPGTWCFVNIHVNRDTPWYHRLYTNVFGLMTVLNILVICTCNIMVIGTLLSVRISRTQKLSATSFKRRQCSTSLELEIQMSIVLLVITIVFVSSWLPLDIRLFLNQIFPHTCREEHISDLVAVRMASFNQIIDPWAYIICRRVFTSKIWKCCRSLLIGRNISLKRNGSPTVLQTEQNAENGKSSLGAQMNKSLTSSKRRRSLPSADKAKIIYMDSVYHVSEIDRRQKKLLVTVREKIRKGKHLRTYYKETPSAVQNQDRATQCSCRKNGISKRHSGKAVDELSRPSPNMVERRQFRVPVMKKNFSWMRGSRRFSSRKCSHSYTLTPLEDSVTESDTDIHQNKVYIRSSHSWGSLPSSYKFFRTKSTQTLEFEKDID